MTPPTPRWLARHIAAAHDTNPEREAFAPARLADAALRAEFDPAGAAAAAAAAAVTPAAVAANLPARLSDAALRAASVASVQDAITAGTIKVGTSARRRQVATRAGFPSSNRNLANGGTVTDVQQVHPFVLTEDVSDLSFTFGNFYRSAATATSLLGLSSVTIRLSLWDGTTTFPVFWPNGSRDLVLEPGAQAHTTPLLFKGVKGQRLWLVRLMRWATAPTVFPVSPLINSSAPDQGEIGNALADRTTSYSPNFVRTAGSFTVLPPLAITATAKAGPVVGILGDSIASDATSDYNATDDPDYGWAQGGLGAVGIPWVNLGQSNLQLAHVMANRNGRAQLLSMLSASGMTHLLVALGTNDLSALRTPAAILADFATLKAELAPMGIKVIPTTCTPRTNAANNAAIGSESFTSRATLNTSLRANNGVGDGFYDLAAATEDPNNPNLWRTDIRAATGITVVTGGTGYKGNDAVFLPGGVSFGATVTAGAITGYNTPAGLGGWVVDPPATVSPIRVVSNDPASRGLATGTGATFSYTGVGPVATVSDGIHPTNPLTRWIRQHFAAAAPALFTV